MKNPLHWLLLAAIGFYVYKMATDLKWHLPGGWNPFYLGTRPVAIMSAPAGYSVAIDALSNKQSLTITKV